jgi:phage tail sheath protein FI
MASVIKLATPGVYVQEISTFPPSVAEVETAIPAFIGYTEKAAKAGVDLKKIPTKVTDFSQYTLWFGGPQPEAADSIVVTVADDGNGNFTATTTTNPAKQSKHNLAYAVRHYFDNGGATCYVVSVGPYAAAPGTVVAKDLTDGLAVVNDVDEVTLLVIPEARYRTTTQTSCKR